MLPKIKRFMKKYKKQITIGVMVLLVFIVFLILFKSLFYSSSEKSTYGVRLRDIKENEFASSDKKDLDTKVSAITGVKDVKVEVKGRLIKIFVKFEDGISTDDMKVKFNEIISFVSEKVKGYYDITLYAEQTKDDKTSYPVIGYKHKNNNEISFDVL